MKKITLLLSLLFVVGGTLLAQRTVTGSVTDTEGTPLIGASILVQGTSSGTVTDFDGNFSIKNVPATATTLVVSYTGYATNNVDITNDDAIDIVLEDNAIGLTEIVVSGQGVGIERKRLTTTVDVISSEQLELAPITQLDQVLQSRLPGAQIRLSSGQPGTASIIRNRGPITANGSSTPVIIIDGVRVDNLNSNPQLGLNTGGASSSALADIPIESIDRVEFIRGGAATTLYGADAANGVLQIFTKKGTSGSARLTGGAIVGTMVGETRFLRFDQTADAIFEPGLVQQYRVGVDGGGDQATYNFSGSFYDDDGFNDLNEQRRISARFGTHANIGKNISYDGSASFTSNYFTRDYNANTSFSRFSNLESGDYGDLGLLSGAGLDSIRTQLLEEGSLTDITEAVRRFQTSQTLTYKPFDGFTSRIIVGLDSRRSRQEEIATNALYISKGLVAPGTSNRGTIDRSTRDFIALTADLALGYEVQVGKDFSFNTQVGTQVFRNQDEQLLLSGSNLIEGSVSLNNTAEITTQDYFEAITFGGFYVAENVGFKDKLFLDLGLRWDFNSAFGESIGLVNLKRIGIRYSLTDEPFMQEGNIANILTRFSLRANYGEASNFPTAFARDQVFNSQSFFGVPAYNFGNPGNSDLGPEIVKSYEFGGDFSFLKGRVGGSVTYYNSTTENAIFTPPSVPSSGQLAQEANVGEIENTGFEFEAYVNVIERKDFSLSFNASLVTNENVVTSSGGAPEFNVGGFQFLGSFVKEGLPLGYFRGTRASTDAAGDIVLERNAVLGKPNPDGYGTVGVNLTYKRFTVFGSSDYQYGAQGVAVDDVLRFFNSVEDEGRFPEDIQPFADDPTFSFANLANFWVENTDFIKVRNLGISYRVPTAGSPFSYLKVGFNARNPFVFGSSRFDPEVTGAGIGAQNGFGAGGFGFATESAPRQYLLSIDFGF